MNKLTINTISLVGSLLLTFTTLYLIIFFHSSGLLKMNWLINFISYPCAFPGGTPNLKIDICFYPSQTLVVLLFLLVSIFLLIRKFLTIL